MQVRIVDAKAGETELGDPEVIVDALFGTGFSGAPRPEAAALIEKINASGARVLAVDLPSGVDASTGEVAGAAVRADETVTFHARKVGLVVAPGRFKVGALRVADIGLESRDTEAKLATVELLQAIPRPRELVRRVLAEVRLPVVVDADALFELEPAAWAGPRVLTPHEGELARLLGRESKEVAAHRLASVHEAAQRFDCVVLLKGSDTL